MHKASLARGSNEEHSTINILFFEIMYKASRCDYPSESLGFWALVIARNSRLENTAFQKQDLCPSSAEGRVTPTLLGPLGRANLGH
jgi:hypothetical protein